MKLESGKEIYDVIIVGAGPAGCSAAMVLSRSRRKVLLIDEGRQRNLKSHGIHNYLTRDGILPADFLGKTYEELAAYNIHISKARAIHARKLANKGFEIKDNKGGCYLCKRLLLATGVTDNIPDIPGMQELWGSSVFHCPFCDGWECHDNTIGLYARRYNGYGMAFALKHLSEKVVLFTDGAKYLRTWQREQLQARHIDVVSDKVARLHIAENKLQHVELANGKLIEIHSMFVHHGHKVNNDLSTQLGCRLTKKGAAITNRTQQTSVDGVYVAGDASFDMHFVTVAAAEGLKAAVAIHDDLLKTENLF